MLTFSSNESIESSFRIMLWHLTTVYSVLVMSFNNFSHFTFELPDNEPFSVNAFFDKNIQNYLLPTVHSLSMLLWKDDNMLPSIYPKLIRSLEWVQQIFHFLFSIERWPHEIAVQWSIERSDQCFVTPENVELFLLHAYHRTDVSIFKLKEKKNKTNEISRDIFSKPEKIYLASCWNRFRCFPYRLPCITRQKHTWTQSTLFRLVCVFAIIHGNCYTQRRMVCIWLHSATVVVIWLWKNERLTIVIVFDPIAWTIPTNKIFQFSIWIGRFEAFHIR